MDYYSNTNIEEFDRFVEFLGFGYTDSINSAQNVFIKLEDYIFPGKQGKSSIIDFSNHEFSLQELNLRFNKLLGEFASFENKFPGSKQYRFLSINLLDVKSTASEDLFKWSYFNHKFAASQGQDTAAMNEWHRLDEKIPVNQITKFKARRETNLAFFMHVINNHRFFDQIVFSGIPLQIKQEIKFGLDIAEEIYIAKLIKEHQAQGKCRIVENGLSSVTLNLMINFIKQSKKKLKGHILANSRKLNPYLLADIKGLFAYIGIQESSMKECDFVYLINDLDTLSIIPAVDTDKPIFTSDLSQISTPNYAYMLLKDDGFTQIFSFAKKHTNETAISTMIRAICAGLMLFVNKRKFIEQLAINYMDDYFTPLAAALNKDIKDFQSPIDLLTEKLELEKKHNAT